jgi:chaperonin GroEL
MKSKVIYGREAREKLKEGVDHVANPLKVTLGPRGRNVVIELPSSSKAYHPIITKDGVTVARNLDVGDNILAQGAKVAIGVSEKTVYNAGDGTTSVSVILQALMHMGVRLITDRVNPLKLVDGMEKAMDLAIEYIDKMTVPCQGKLMDDVAIISANNNEEMGKMVADAYKKIGKDGDITVKKSGTYRTFTEISTGLIVDNTPDHRLYPNDPEKGMMRFNDPLVFVSSLSITRTREELAPILDVAITMKRPIVMIVDEIEGEAVSVVQGVHKRGDTEVCVISAPYGKGPLRDQTLEDLATFLGCQVFSEANPVDAEKLKDPNYKGFGNCEIFNGDYVKGKCTFVSGHGEKEKINSKAVEIKNAIEKSEDDREKEWLKDRLRRFMGNVAIIYVGGNSEPEVETKSALYDDAIHAVKAAMAEGVVPGGGVAYFMAGLEVGKLIANEKDKSFRIGMEITVHALQEPIKQIMRNCSFSERKIKDILNDIVKENGVWSTPKYSFDAHRLKIVDMKEEGIVDPAKVAKVCVKNSVSAAYVLLTTEALVYSEANHNNYLKSLK